MGCLESPNISTSLARIQRKAGHGGSIRPPSSVRLLHEMASKPESTTLLSSISVSTSVNHKIIMCLIGLLLPFKYEKHRPKHSSRSSDRRGSHQRSCDYGSSERRRSDHRSSERRSSDHRSSDHKSSHRRSSEHRSSDHSSGSKDRRRSDHTSFDPASSSHRRSRHSQRDESRRKEKDEFKDLSRRTEDAIARLCVSLEQSFLEEQRSWREQERLDRYERYRLGLDGLDHELPPSEEAPPYSLMDENPRRPPPVPQTQTGAADGRECNTSRNRDSAGWVYCCRSCVCARCGSSTVNCPPLPELDDTRPRSFMESGADSRR